MPFGVVDAEHRDLRAGLKARKVDARDVDRDRTIVHAQQEIRSRQRFDTTLEPLGRGGRRRWRGCHA